MRFRYRIAGAVLELPEALPGLEPADHEEPNLTAVLSAAPPPEHEVVRRLRNGDFEWLRISRAPGLDGPLFEFPGFATFALDTANARVVIHPETSTDRATLWHLLLDNVLPMWMAHTGELVLHASSIALGDNGDRFAVLFIGLSGAGKSSTALGCAQAGATLLGDDFALITLAPGTPHVVPSNVGVRLWEDMATALAPGRTGEQVASYLPKVWLHLEETAATHRGPVPVGALAFLGPRLPSDSVPSIETIAPTEAYIRLLQQSFRADIQGIEANRDVMDQFAALLNAVPAVQLRMPDDAARLAPASLAALAALAEARRRA